MGSGFSTFAGHVERLIYLRHNDICCIAVNTGGEPRPDAATIERSPEPNPLTTSIAARAPLMPTIALVDDDRNILTSLRMVLEAEGYKTQTYNDGASALDGFAESPPDL